MAAQISHILAGERAAESALENGARDRRTGEKAIKSREIFGDAAVFFALGCQGPDIFYHNQRTRPSGLHYGALAHRRRYGSLVAGAAASLAPGDRRPDSPSGAYLLGLATHAAIDRATHPFIIYFSGWFDPADPATARYRGCHAFLERILDIGLLREAAGVAPRDFGLSARLGLGASGDGSGAREDESGSRGDGSPAETSDSGLVALWSAGLLAAYPHAAGADTSLGMRITNALADARNFYAVTEPAATASDGKRDSWLRRLERPEGRRILALVYPEKIPKDLDALNLAHEEWQHPAGDGRGSRASYLDLIDEGIAQAARSIRAVVEFWEGRLDAASLAAALGESALALCDAEGAPAPPRLCRPLALAEAIEREYEARVGRANGRARNRSR